MEVNELVKYLSLTIISYLFFIKVVSANLTTRKKVSFGIGYVFLTTLTFIKISRYVVEPYRTVIVIIGASLLLSLLLKKKLDETLTSLIIVLALSYIIYFFSASIAFFIFSPFQISGIIVTIICIATGIISIATTLLVSNRINFTFIYYKYSRGLFISISGIIIVLYGLFREGRNISDERAFLLIFGFILLGFGIYSWLRREDAFSQYRRSKNLIEKKQQAILKQKEKDYETLKKMHDYLAMVVHKDDKKIDAMERIVGKVVLRTQQSDILLDAKKILDEISILKEKSEKEYNEKLFNEKILPKTGLQIVDAKFETVSEKAMLKDIDFTLTINGDVSGMDSIIPQFDLANIIGDLAENAFIAINHLKEDQSYHKIEFKIIKNESVYELSISDSGIPFEIDTLIKLGVEQVTSHKDDGGNGYGYLTIFELLDDCNASLNITEYETKPSGFSKNITIQFNGKSQYIIKSFRANMIRKRNNNTNLIITSSCKEPVSGT